MQKYFDQAISGNWSYNPEHFTDNQVPISKMAEDLLMTYRLGWKTSYYQNTYDAKRDIDEPAHGLGWKDNVKEEAALSNPATEHVTSQIQEEDCDSCTI